MMLPMQVGKIMLQDRKGKMVPAEVSQETNVDGPRHGNNGAVLHGESDAASVTGENGAAWSKGGK